MYIRTYVVRVCMRPSVDSVHPSVHPPVRPSIHPCVRPVEGSVEKKTPEVHLHEKSLEIPEEVYKGGGHVTLHAFRIQIASEQR